MMTIIDKLAETIKALPLDPDCTHKHLPFVYADEDIQNIVFDDIQPPFVACIPIQSGIVQDDNGILRERVTMALWFADLMDAGTAGDYDAVANERIIHKCKVNALRWGAMMSIPQSGLKLVSINGSIRAYLKNDAYLTGYMLNVTLEDMDGISRCNL